MGSSAQTPSLPVIRSQDLQDPNLYVLNQNLATIWGKIIGIYGGAGPINVQNTFVAPTMQIPSQTTVPTDNATVLTLGAALQLFSPANIRQALVNGVFNTSPTSTIATQPIPGSTSSGSGGPGTGGVLDLAERTVTASTTFTTTDFAIYESGGALTLTLPLASGFTGYVFCAKNTSNGVVTLSTTGGNTIDGLGGIPLNQNQAVLAQSDGSNWKIISRYTANEYTSQLVSTPTTLSLAFDLTVDVAGTTLTLPTAANSLGRILFVKNYATSSTTVTRSGSDLIDGNISVVVSSGGGSIFIAQSGIWYTLAVYSATLATFYRSTAVSTSLTTSDFFVEATAAPVTLTLPNPSGLAAGYMFALKNVAASGNVTVNAAAGNIDGAGSYTLGPNASIIVQSDGSTYWTLARTGSSSGLSLSVRSSAVNTSYTTADFGIIATGAGMTVTAPLASSAPQSVFALKNDATGTITLLIASGTIEGSLSSLPLYPGQSIIFQSDGSTNYNIIGSYGTAYQSAFFNISSQSLTNSDTLLSGMTFSAPSTGTYNISFTVQYQWVTGDTGVAFSLYKNGVQFSSYVQFFPVATATSFFDNIPGLFLVPVHSGDTIEVRGAKSGSGGASIVTEGSVVAFRLGN